MSTIFSAFGMMGETVALGWIALELTDSSFMVGLVMGARMIPQFLLGIPAGAVVDMADRRLFIPLINIASAVPSSILGLVLMFELEQFWHVVALAIVAGSLAPFQQTARQSYAYDIVGPAMAVQGLATMMLASRLGGLIGAVVAGSVIARMGSGMAFFLIAGSQIMAGLIVTLVRSSGQAAPSVRESVLANLKGYMREIRRNYTLQQLMFFTGAVEMLGFSHQTLLPSLARDVMRVGAEGLGFMSGVQSVGGIIGVAVLAALGGIRRKGMAFLIVIHVFGGALVLLAYAPSLTVVILVLAVISASAALSDVLSQSLMQLNVPNELRGRAMGSWVLAIGTAPVGHMQIGGLATLVGVASALIFNGVGLVVLAATTTLFSARLRRL